jgi:hypothetical protein
MHCSQKNILVNIPSEEPDKPIAWIADFGLTVHDGRAATYVTQQFYRAPELESVRVDLRPVHSLKPRQLKKRYKTRRKLAAMMEKADIYSFGLLVFHVCLRLSTQTLVFKPDYGHSDADGRSHR